MRLFQFIGDNGKRGVAANDPSAGSDAHRLVLNCATVRELAIDAWRSGRNIAAEISARGLGEEVDIAELLAAGRVLPPLDHPDPSRLMVSITGLTHLGSAASRDQMHKAIANGELTDSMRMFQIGLNGGKPQPGREGAQPEWAWKGDGQCIRKPGADVEMFSFGNHLGEEAEIVGLYTIADNGTVLRIGYALGNEFSDHVLEKTNYLYLAHSKLRPCAIGPELRVGDLPNEIEGCVRILRNGEQVWSAPFLSGEDNMCHSLANLEAHHFKYPAFRRAGDVHAHFLGASVLSHADGFKTQDGDVVEVSAPSFGAPLRSTLKATKVTHAKVVAL